MYEIRPFDYILVKLAARCNINCTYCYWFRDESVYSKPVRLSVDAERAFLTKLREHIQRYKLSTFSILFHGGEPLLFGKKRFLLLCESLRSLAAETDCRIPLSMTTNGVLVDTEWASLLRYFSVSTTLSIDGPETEHNRNRVDFKGNGTYDQVVTALEHLRRFEIDLGVLAVCNPTVHPSLLLHHFVDILGLPHFDILLPDATHDDEEIPAISSFYINLFESWRNDYYGRTEIRIIRSFLLGLLGFNTTSEGLGFGPLNTLTLLTDGSLEPLDVLRISRKGTTKTDKNVFANEIQDVADDVVWLEAYRASLSLNSKCLACDYKTACGGGYLPHRWSTARRYDNPSVYCDDLQSIFSHIWETINRDIYVSIGDSKIALSALDI